MISVRRWRLVIGVFLTILPLGAVAEEGPRFQMTPDGTGYRLSWNDQVFAEFVPGDEKTPRPYFHRLTTPSGRVVTRNHPPLAGRDKVDHPHMHPGFWLALADLNGVDFWRLKGRVLSQVQQPIDKDGFTTRERYFNAAGQEIATGTTRYRFARQPEGVLIDATLELQSPDGLTLGDQEEMGFGVRVATPLNVENGGQILNSHGQKNGAEVWGKTAKWCDYSGRIDGQDCGLLLVPHAGKFRPSWFHARDYGLLVANPFGRKAFGQGEASHVVVPANTSFRWGVSLLIHEGAIDLAAAADRMVKRRK